MATLTLHVNPQHPEPRKIAHAAAELEKGGVALYPTDTVYALGCALDARKAIDRLYAMKRMDRKHQLALVVPDIAEAARYGIVSDFAYRQMRRLTPGPYTVILTATRETPRVLMDRRRQIGVRIPDHAVTQALVRALGRPLLTTSALPPGESDPVPDVEDGKRWWRDLDVAIDGGLVPNQPSTVVSFIDDQIDVLREGLGLAALLE